MVGKKLKKDFMEFIKEFKIVSVAIAFVAGLAVNDLVQTFVSSILMPLIDPLVAGTWKTAVLKIGPVSLGWGMFLNSLIHFLIIMLVIFIVVKKLLKYEPAKG